MTDAQMMTVKEAAAALDGCEYREEGTKALFDAMKTAGLVAVFGASDDLMEFRGAIDDEVDCYNGGPAYLTQNGLVKNICASWDCPYFVAAQNRASMVEAVWDRDGFSWVYETAIRHETFIVNEDGETYCRGIVFALADVPA